MNLQETISRIKNNLEAESYSLAATEAVKIIEIALRKLLVDGLSELSEQDRLCAMNAILEIGKGQKGVESFGLGQIIAVIRKCDFNSSWEKATGSDLSAIKMINMDALNAIRVRLTHSSAEVSSHEAQLIYHALQVLINTFGLLTLDEKIKISQGNNATTASDHESGVQTSKLQNKRTRRSVYCPTYGNETNRLNTQAAQNIESDLESFKIALNMLPANRKSNLNALDVGCASGTVTKSRFLSFGVFSSVLGIDHNEDAIEIAKENNDDNNFSFQVLDFPTPDALSEIDEYLKTKDAKGFDFIFSALTIHHMKDPQRAVREMRKLLNDGGVVILRGSEDNSKMAFPDESNLVQEIVNHTSTLPGVSDRQNGRKLYFQLWKAGFRDIKILIRPKTTAGLSIDERLLLFEESFSYRINYLKKILDKTPSDQRWNDEFRIMESRLDELEMCFESEDFFYSEQVFSAIAKKVQ